MSRYGRRVSRVLSFRWFAKPWDRGQRAGAGVRRRRSMSIPPGVAPLEDRALLSVSAVVGPMPSQEVLNVQLQSSTAPALAAVTARITEAGGTIQPTSIPGLYRVQGATPNMGRLAAELAADPVVRYAE